MLVKQRLVPDCCHIGTNQIYRENKHVTIVCHGNSLLAKNIQISRWQKS